jgi:UDP-glucose 4-epimerase
MAERGAILITGDAGYIGSHCCKAIAEAGFQPVSYDNLSTGHADFVQWGPLVVGDVSDYAKVAAGLDVPLVFKERRAGDPPILVADPSKAKRKLGFTASRSDLPHIIRSAWAWHQKAHPSRKSTVPA